MESTSLPPAGAGSPLVEKDRGAAPVSPPRSTMLVAIGAPGSFADNRRFSAGPAM